MKNNELVWRELVDAAVESGRRRWDSIDDVAFRAGVAASTAAYALRRMIEIGAVRQHHAGFTLVNPRKALTTLCAARSLESDALAQLSIVPFDLRWFENVVGANEVILGGGAAAVHLLGGSNTVADYSQHIVYLRGDLAVSKVDALQYEHQDSAGTWANKHNLTLLPTDRRAARNWRRYTSFAQTYADLFATPGWWASEFRLALDSRFLRERDWDQE